MRKLYVRVVAAILFSSSPLFAQSVVVGSGSWEEVGPGAQVVVQPAGVDVQSGGSFVMAGSASTALAQFLGPAAGVPISVQSGGSIQLTWAKLENLTTLTIAAGGSLLRIRETSFEDSLALSSPWIDISVVSDRENLPFSFNRVTFQGSASRKNIKASASTPMVRVLGNSASPGNKWGSGGEDDPGNVISWHSGIVTRANPSGVYDTVEEALRATGTVAGSTITVNLGHAMIDDVVDFNTLPSNGASSAGPSVVNACLAPLVGKGFFDSDVDSTRRGKIVNCVLARGSVEETTAENCTFFDPRTTFVISMNFVDCKNCLIESAYSGSNNITPADCIAALSTFFSSASNYDFHLASPGGDAAIDMGIVLSTTVDFEATPRGAIGKAGGAAAWDIGADEVPCARPSSLVIVGNGSTATLTWAAVAGATSYNIKRATVPGGPYTIVPGGAGVTQTSFTDSGLSAGTSYYYVVEASNSGGTSSISDQVSLTPLPAPTGLSATGYDGRVELSWNSVPGAYGYAVLRSTSSGGPYSDIDVTTTLTFSDTYVLNGTTYFYVVCAVDVMGNSGSNSTQASATPQSAGQTNILLVVGTVPPPQGSGDEAIASRLGSLGYAVVIKPAGGAGAAQTSDASGKVLVAISATANPTDVGTKFTNVTVPVLTWNGGTLYALGMVSGNQAGTDFGTVANQTQVALYNDASPIVSWLTNLPQPVVVSTSSIYSWSSFYTFGSTALTVAGDTTKVLLATYEAGKPMPGLASAPAKRVSLFLSTDTLLALNSTGQSLLDAAVQWTIGAPDQLQAVWASVESGQITLHWEVSGGATTYSVLRAPSSSGPFTLIASGLTVTTYTDMSLQDGTTYYYQVLAANGVGQSVPSAVIAAVPQAAVPIAVAFRGGTHLFRKATGDPNDLWNSRDFTARLQIGGVDVNPAAIVPFAGSDYWIPLGPVGVTGQTSLNCTLAALPDRLKGPAMLTYHVKVNTVWPQTPAVWQPVGPIRLHVSVGPQYAVWMRFHFPSDGVGKRTAWNLNGYPNLFEGDANDTTWVRRTERTALATYLASGIKNIWNQVTINGYAVTVCYDMTHCKLGDGAYNSNNELNRGRASSGGARALELNNDTQHNSDPNVQYEGVVNVYVVRAIWNTSGVTVSNKGGGYAKSDNVAIIISDIAVPNSTTIGGLSHELGHVLGLAHPDEDKNPFLNPIRGTINNLQPVIPTEPPLYEDWYLMGKSGQGKQAFLIAEYEANYARKILEIGKQGSVRIVAVTD